MKVSERECRFCGHPGGQHTIEFMTSGVHSSKVLCGGCGRGLGFDPKPETDATKYKRPASHTDLVKKYSKGFCEMCLTPKDILPRGQTLEAQHVVEYQDGGTEDRENIWIVCTGCHRLIHWRRTYLQELVSMVKSMKRWEEPANGRDRGE